MRFVFYYLEGKRENERMKEKIRRRV